MTKETREAIIEKFIDWQSLSEVERKKLGLPLTQAEFAIAHGVSASVVTQWKKHTTIDELLIKELKDRIYNSAMGKEAKSKDRELAAKVFNLMSPQDITLKMELTANDYARVAEQVTGQLRDNYKEHGGICPVCGRYEALLPKLCLDTEPQYGSEN